MQNPLEIIMKAMRLLASLGVRDHFVLKIDVDKYVDLMAKLDQEYGPIAASFPLVMLTAVGDVTVEIKKMNHMVSWWRL